MSISDAATVQFEQTECSPVSQGAAQLHDLLRAPAAQCQNDLLLYLAHRATEYQRSPHFNFCSNLPPEIIDRILDLFGSHAHAAEVVHHLLVHLSQPHAIADSCQKSLIGKKLPAALYVHRSAINALDPTLRLYESWGRQLLSLSDQMTLVKFHTNQPIISYLFYPDFDHDPHPALESSIQVNLQTGTINSHHYSTRENPPILHRKETFVTPDYPHYEKFAQLTQAEVELGLLSSKNSLSQSPSPETADTLRIYRSIGTRKGWLQHLAQQRVEIRDHSVVRISSSESPKNSSEIELTPTIKRHRAALVRRTLSRPVRLALEAELFDQNSTFFDYGCGHGGDIERMAEQGYQSTGWDPYYSPKTPLVSSDIVNLGYVINVIECQTERREALVQAWELTQQVLIVAAQILIDDRDRGIMAYGDGIITRRNTFQKYYQQDELKTYIDQVLNVDAIPIDLGVYFIFRDEKEAQNFRASRFRSRLSSPQIRTPVQRFEDYEDLLKPLMQFVSDRGRLPVTGELPEEDTIVAEFATIKRAFKVILQATDPQEWEQVAAQRRQDFLVYLALSKLSHRPKLSQLSEPVINDIRGLFGSYKKACDFADVMLYSMGNPDVIADCCFQSKIGQKRSQSFWVHLSVLEQLDPLLRLYEGCANQTIGRLEDATLVKFHIKSPKITYLFYPEFDSDPHPALHTSMEIDLRDLHVRSRRYEGPNPPILHRKEAFVTPEYPHFEKFAKLTRQEQSWGLLDDLKAIQTRQSWLKCLADHCAEIRGHRVYWLADADPYKVKIIQAARRTRRKLH